MSITAAQFPLSPPHAHASRPGVIHVSFLPSIYCTFVMSRLMEHMEHSFNATTSFLFVK